MTLRDLAENLPCRLLGEGSSLVTTVSSLQSANAESLVFVEDPKYLDAAFTSSAAAVIAGEFAAKASAHKPLLIAGQPRLAFARAAKVLRSSRATTLAFILRPSCRLRLTWEQRSQWERALCSAVTSRSAIRQ